MRNSGGPEPGALDRSAILPAVGWGAGAEMEPKEGWGGVSVHAAVYVCVVKGVQPPLLGRLFWHAFMLGGGNTTKWDGSSRQDTGGFPRPVGCCAVEGKMSGLLSAD
jgi:hypothetical protein